PNWTGTAPASRSASATPSASPAWAAMRRNPKLRSRKRPHRSCPTPWPKPCRRASTPCWTTIGSAACRAPACSTCMPSCPGCRRPALLRGRTPAAARTDDTPVVLQRLLNLVEHIAQRSAYLALLAEYPETLARVARSVQASPWASEYLTRYPLLLDSLIEWRSLMQAPDFPALAEQLRNDLDACVLPDGQPDVEQQMNLMRDVQHQVTFQLLAQDRKSTRLNS